MISSANISTPFLPAGMNTQHQFEVDSQTQQVLQMCYQHYADTLNADKNSQSYLKKRCITERTVVRFGLGLSNRSLPLKMPKRFSPADSRDALKMTGFLKPSGHEIFRGSITVPIWFDGEIVGGYGRRLTNRIYADSTAHPYHLTDETALFNQDCLTFHNAVVLTKSPLEAISTVQCGIENVISTVGGFALSKTQAELLKKFGIKRVKVLVNLSPYYLKKAQLITKELKTVGITCKVAQLPQWQDVNHLICHHSNVKEQLSKLLHHAKVIGE